MKDIQVTNAITVRESHVVETYLSEIKKINLIEHGEEAILAQKIKQGDKAALDKLVSTNLRFVVSVAKKYQHQGLPLSDLIAEGNLGLIRAAQKFDETKGFKFISYAVWWIRQSMLEAIASHSRMIRLPLNRTGAVTKMNKGIAVLEQQNERPPTPEELAEFLNTSLEEVKEAITLTQKTWSYDKPFPDADEDSYSLLDRIASNDDPTDKELLTEENRQQLSQFLQTLNHKERQVITATYGLLDQQPLVPQAIAELIGVSPGTVANIKKQGLEKLRREQTLTALLIT